MAQYLLGSSNPLLDTPVCGMNEVELSVPVCTGDNPSVELSGWSNVKFIIDSSEKNYKCMLSLVTWAGTDVRLYGIRRIVRGCTFVSLDETDVGIPFVSGSVYAFEYEKFALADDINTENPRCVTTPLTMTLTRPNSGQLLGSHISIFRPDQASVLVRLNGAGDIPFKYGVCKVSVNTYNGISSATEWAQIGKCDEVFDFQSDSKSMKFLAGDQISFVYRFFPNGYSRSSTYIGPSTSSSTFQLADVNCPEQLTIDHSPPGTYVFKIEQPVPMSGWCLLMFGNSPSSMAIKWADCGILRLTYYDMLAVYPSLNPGTTVDFRYAFGKNLRSSTVTCYSNTVTMPVRVHYPLTLSSATGTSFTLNLGSPDGDYFSGKSVTSVLVNMYGCGSAVDFSTPKGSVTVSSAPFAFTFTNGDSNGAVAIALGATCYCEAFVKDNTSGALDSAQSGHFPAVAVSGTLWTSIPKPRLAMYAKDCVIVSWEALAVTPVGAITCYEISLRSKQVSASNPGPWFVVRHCTDTDALGTSYHYCGFASGLGLEYQYMINAQNPQLSSTYVSDWFSPEDMKADASAVYYSSVISPYNTFAVGSFPRFTIQSSFVLAPGAGAQANPKMFVGILVNVGSLDSATHTNMISQTLGSSLVGPLAADAPPVFTQIYTYSVRSGRRFYDLIVPDSTVLVAGQYSLVTYAGQVGGLRGQFWANPVFRGTTPDLDTVTAELNLDWGSSVVFTTSIYSSIPNSNVYDLFSVRWTGFVEAEYSELHTFVADTNGAVKMWVDNGLIIDHGPEVGPCNSDCFGTYFLQQSSEVLPLNERKLHYIRIDMVFTKALVGNTTPRFVLKWSSLSRELAVVPNARLIAAYPIQGFPDTKSGLGAPYDLPTIFMKPTQFSASQSTVSIPSTHIVAGEPFVVDIVLRGSHGNVQLTTSDRLQLLLRDSANVVVTSVLATLVTGQTGMYSAVIKYGIIGDYVLDTQIYIGNVWVSFSLEPLKIVPGDIALISADMPSIVITGSDLTVSFGFTDINGQTVSIDDDFDLKQLSLVAKWTSDVSGLSRLDVSDLEQVQRMNATCEPTRVYLQPGEDVVKAVFQFRYQGSYTLIYQYGGDAILAVGSNILTAFANPDDISGIYSEIVSSPFPPESLTSGSTVAFYVQVRDKFMNPLHHSSVAGASVTIQLPGTLTVGACIENSSPDFGVFRCTITPGKSGSDLELSVKVNGEDVRSSSGIEGPWKVSVLSGSVDISKSVVAGVQATSIIAQSVPITILLRDGSGNPLQSPPQPLPVPAIDLVSITNIYPATISSFSMEGNDTMKVTFSFATLTAGSNVGSLLVFLDGVQITVDSGFTNKIRINPGLPDATRSSCTISGLGNSRTISPIPFTCTLNDYENNVVSYDQGTVNMNFRLTSNHSVEFSSVSTSNTGTLTGSVSLPVAGVYEFMGILNVPGGLFAEYYDDRDATKLTSLTDSIGSNSRFTGESNVYYSTITPTIQFDRVNDVFRDSMHVGFIRWWGFVNIGGIATEIHITGNGAVRLKLGGVVVLDRWGPNTSPDYFFNEDVDLLANTYSDIEILYKPSPTDAQIYLTYTELPSGVVMVVPSGYLYRPERITSNTPSIGQITVQGGDLESSTTSIIFPFNAMSGTPTTFFIYLQDMYSNTLPSSSCTSIVFSVVDLAGNTIGDAFVGSTASATVLCSTLSSLLSGGYYVGTVQIDKPIEGLSISANIYSSSGMQFSINTNVINMATPTDPKAPIR